MKANSPGPAGRKGGGQDPAQLAGIGLQFALVLVAFLFAGKWLDERLGTEPWLMMAGVFLGFGLSVFWMYRRLVLGDKEKR
ncbi:AtpZ/AtpI family protein [Longimicrobium sp.]|uniref:AtpZ/AtpI family protein n=1 Tax=Longimicrobium sp. TaxID=2029185 RepID=UPI003B3B7C96